MYFIEPVGEKHRSWLEEFFSPEEASKCIAGWNSYTPTPTDNIITRPSVCYTESSYVMYRDYWYAQLTGNNWTCFIGGTAIHPDFRDRGQTVRAIAPYFDKAIFEDPEYHVVEYIGSIPKSINESIRCPNRHYELIDGGGDYNLVKVVRETYNDYI